MKSQTLPHFDLRRVHTSLTFASRLRSAGLFAPFLAASLWFKYDKRLNCNRHARPRAGGRLTQAFWRMK